MSLQAVELHSADEVRAHARAVHARIRAAYMRPLPSMDSVLRELEATKQDRDQYRALADERQGTIISLMTRLERFTKRLTNLQHDAIVAQDVQAEPQPPTCDKITIDKIMRATCEHYGKSKTDLICKRRTTDLVHPRQVAIYLCKEMTLHSMPEIGRRFGGRDHTTVIHAHKKISALITTVPSIDHDVKAIMARLVTKVVHPCS